MYQNRSVHPPSSGEKRTSSFDNATLMIRRCGRCARLMTPTAASCSRCSNRDLDWVPSTGAGVIISCRIVHRKMHRPPTEHAPSVLAVVKLDDGPWVFSALESAIRPIADQRVRVHFRGGVVDGRFPVFAIDDPRHEQSGGNSVDYKSTADDGRNRSEHLLNTDGVFGVAWVRTAFAQCDFLEATKSVNVDENSLIKFAVQWAPFGGADSGELLVAFGVTREKYMRLLREALKLQRTDNPAIRTLKRRLLEALVHAWREGAELRRR